MSFTTLIPNPPVYESPYVQGHYKNGFINQYYGTTLKLEDRSGHVVAQAVIDIRENGKAVQEGIFEKRRFTNKTQFFNNKAEWVSDVLKRHGPRRLILKVNAEPWRNGYWLSEADWNARNHDTLIIPVKASKKTDEPPKKRRA
jgi:hypothetical protein